MSENVQNTETAPPPDYGKLIVEQDAKVKKLEEQKAKDPSDGVTRELDRAADRLRYYATVVKRDPKARAERSAQTARNAVLERALAAPGR